MVGSSISVTQMGSMEKNHQKTQVLYQYKMPPSLYGGDYGGFTTLYIYIYGAWW